MSGGGGGGFFDDAIESVTPKSLTKGMSFKSVMNDTLNLFVQSATGTLLGYEDGKISNGVGTEVLKSAGKSTLSGVKEITGAKAAEDANALARQQFEEQKVAAAQERQDAIVRKGREQMQASQLAGAARKAGQTPSTLNQGLKLGSAEKDFLGL